jgi:hypothetical protein
VVRRHQGETQEYVVAQLSLMTRKAWQVHTFRSETA